MSLLCFILNAFQFFQIRLVCQSCIFPFAQAVKFLVAFRRNLDGLFMADKPRPVQNLEKIRGQHLVNSIDPKRKRYIACRRRQL